jgi:rubrerythrin
MLPLADLRAMARTTDDAETAKAYTRARERAKRAAVFAAAGISLDDLVKRGLACNGCGSNLKAGKCPFCSPAAGLGKP